MKSVCKNITIALLMLAILGCASYASDLKSSIDITRIGKGARPIALGGAYTALADDTSAIFTNPAGLGFNNRISFTSMSTQLLGCVNYKLIGGSYPTPFGNIAVGYVSATTPGGMRITETGGVTTEHGMLNYTNSIITFSYGTRITDILPLSNFVTDNLVIGASLKLFSQGFTGGSLSDAPTATGTDIDMGFIYNFSDSLSFGTVIQNSNKSTGGDMTWSTGEKEAIEGVNKMGLVYRPAKNIKTVVDMDILQGSAPVVMHGGVEWNAMDQLAVRFGIDQNYQSINDGVMGVSTDLSAGVGIDIGGFKVDYAYHNNSSMPENSTHFISFSYYGAEVQKPKKESKEDKEEEDFTKELFTKQSQAPETKPAEKKSNEVDIYTRLFE